MPIEFNCSQCGKLLRTPDDSAGKKGRCPDCGTVMSIPQQSTAKPQGAAGQPGAKDPYAGSAAPLGADPLGLGPTPGPVPPSKAPAKASPYSSPAANSYQGSRGFSSAGGGGGSNKVGMVLTLGILSLVSAITTYFLACCCWPIAILPILAALGCGIPAWIVGHGELKRYNAGAYGPKGKGEIMAGYVCGITGVALSGLSIIVLILLITLGVASNVMQGGF